MGDSFFGDDPSLRFVILFYGYAGIAAILCLYQLVFLQKMRLIPIYLLPLLSFSCCYENIVLARSNSIEADSLTAGFGYVFNSIIIPCFIIILYEMSFRLHEARQAHFFIFPFDQGSEFSTSLAELSIWLFRLLAAGLCAMNLYVSFNNNSGSDSARAHRGGYLHLAKNNSSEILWLSLIPPIILTIFALLMGSVMYR